MVSEEYPLDKGYSTKSRHNPIELVIVGVLAIAVIAAVVLSIIVLVKVNDASSATTVVGPPGPTVTTQPPNVACQDTLPNSVSFYQAVGIPTPVRRKRQVNVPTQSPITSTSPNYAAYVDAVNQLKIAINVSADPCNNFWGYACGAYPPDEQISFGVVDFKNFETQYNQMIKPQYQQANTPVPLQQTIWFLNKCLDVQANPGSITAGGTIVKTILAAFQNATGLPFPMLNQNTDQTTWLSPTQLGTTLGYLSGTNGVDTLISSFIDTNWMAPRSATPYYLFVDQSSLSLPNTYYQPGTWELFQPGFIAGVNRTMLELAAVSGVTLNPTTLLNDIMDIIKLELALARNLSTDDTTRRQFVRSFNPTTVAQAQTNYSFIDWAAYMQQLSSQASSTVQGMVNTPTFTFSVIEMNMMTALGQSLADGNPYGFTPRQLVNYLTYRLVASQAGYLPSASFLKTKTWYRPPLGKGRYIRLPEPTDPEKFESKALTRAQLICTDETMNYINYANARFFVDALYPDKGVNIRQTAGSVISTILSGFQSMIDQLTWMDPQTKISAYGKINNLVQNIAFPDFILDDNQLTTYFSLLDIAQADDYVTMLNKISKFNAVSQFNFLSRTQCSDRKDFNGPPGTVNAWYQPEVNSITFPAGILQPPYFHPQYPASINYGGLGVVAGHELTHGFDDQGVQWDGVGKLAPWMSASSQQGFKRLADCVINEYNGFCPLPTSYHPNCVKGAQTQGENIADNGGIHAAWRAYKTYVALNGPDPRLPDPVLGQFTHDQLFFLAFGRVWCESRSQDRLFTQLLVDPHSPSQYRVFGTIQNFPAFQSAFNCPTGSTYSQGPGKYCNVWVLDNNSTST